MQWHYLKELTNHSLPEIGDAFGGRDHTTVLHACRKVKELREETHGYKRRLFELSKNTVILVHGNNKQGRIMKFSLSRESLLKAITYLVSGAVERKSTLPILGNTYLWMLVGNH